MSVRSATDYLPHREPFLFLSRIGVVEDGRAAAMWEPRGDEDFFRGHFPHHPVVPGVLLAEALAQVAGVALSSSSDVRVPPGAPGSIAQLELRFHAPVRPPASILLMARRVGGLATLHRFEVAAHLHHQTQAAWDGRPREPWPSDPSARAIASDRLVSGTLVLSVPTSTAIDAT
jgi:3-hydroxyacyl-[acyl-carrier-protein] dehydratase